jgi:hypothetical protein
MLSMNENKRTLLRKPDRSVVADIKNLSQTRDCCASDLPFMDDLKEA